MPRASRPIRIDRATWGRLVALANALDAGSTPGRVSATDIPSNIVIAKADAAIPAGAPVAVKASVGDVDPGGMWRRVVRHSAKVMGPEAPDDAAAGVAVFNIKAGGFGQVLLRGTFGVTVNVVDANHAFAAGDGLGAFRSAEEGPYRIIGKGQGPGTMAAVVAFPVGGGGDGGSVFPVMMEKTGGDAGDATTRCSFTYTIQSFPPGDEPMAEDLNPGDEPSKWRRPNIGTMIAATFGLAGYDPETGDVIVFWCNEVDAVQACEDA